MTGLPWLAEQALLGADRPSNHQPTNGWSLEKATTVGEQLISKDLILSLVILFSLAGSQRMSNDGMT